ncbi:pentapeptide repeat-containing protein [Kitasatospora purpeofusca]|uniref:pentapeptide repeat-containing protein n=1 Tax=Kitasatospora purpeofusca TaxID=67352 RepID=UPI0022529DC2|nr:pentapeptide repeat-containing protein [Kitasatospora purpeofusca]MCX4682712.1 pentapeptide repeat-containing protein [Kitasatospora purpeofusca]MCX4690624.1 pentapeptide repeat-containing protein [Kitasatospora purpeofusca]MCX4690806.1 pentapeptide repeat-containing protein [Kitasatospora purpeofusca]
MTATPSTAIPSWPHCGEGASAADPVGCKGIHVGTGGRCLAHMPPTDRAAYLATLAPGSDIDLRGTTIDGPLLNDILTACIDPAVGKPCFGRANFAAVTFTGIPRFGSATFTDDTYFDSATFTKDAWFDSATFTRDANFRSATFAHAAHFRSATFIGNAFFSSANFARDAHFDSRVTFARDAYFSSTAFTRRANFGSATFTGSARFGSATFTGNAIFGSATFAGDTLFDLATFARHTSFGSATFTGNARFGLATFTRRANFGSATFTKDANFSSATFTKDANFSSATFEGLQHLGPMACGSRVSFDGARFPGTQVTIEAAAPFITFERTAFEGSVVLRLRYATVELSRATLTAPMALQTWPVPFNRPNGTVMDESLLTAGNTPPAVRLASLDGVDAAHLVLTDVNLARCQFTGAFHLDQVQIGFGCHFAEPPTGWCRRGLLPARWSRRKVLSEEQHWRAQTGGRAGRGWPAGPHHAAPERGAGPEDLIGVYQQLRKAFEEAGNEPDAADFYYGEMEMRRHDRQRPRAERRLLWAYWLASGYGLRASRALSWLVAAMGVTLLLMMLFGLPDDAPIPQSSGTYGAGVVTVSTKTTDPVLTLPLERRVSAGRAEKAALVVVNSVVFRSSGQNLTLPGTVIEMASRIGEPVLLGLAALAVRSRVKR